MATSLLRLAQADTRRGTCWTECGRPVRIQRADVELPHPWNHVGSLRNVVSQNHVPATFGNAICVLFQLVSQTRTLSNKRTPPGVQLFSGVRLAVKTPALESHRSNSRM